MKRVELGIDTFKNNPGLILKKRNIILLTNSSNIDSSGIPVYKSIKRLAGNQLKSLWTLQHGFFIDKQDNMILSHSFFWNDLDIEVKSLYSENLLPKEEWLEGVDTIIMDIFDVGTRVYTFLNHTVKILQFLSGKNIDIVVLDRPNPLNGINIEGNVLKDDYSSIVGMIPVPMRHSFTAGEFLNFALDLYKIDIKLEIIKIKSWQRKDNFKGIWTYPSPNMPTFNTAAVYPGAVMLEGTNISEGRGTTRPFEFIGSPFINNLELTEALNKLNLKGVKFFPIFFKPEFSKFKGEICKGIFIYPKNTGEFRSFQTYYEIIRLIKAYYPKKFKWKQPPYEFEYNKLPIDMISGSDFIRKSIEKNLTFEKIKSTIDSEIKKYREIIEPFLLYTL